jgi:hypothetical protein
MVTKSLWERLVGAFRPAAPSEPAAARPTAVPPTAPAEPPFNYDDPRIPQASRERVRLIRTLADDLEKRAGERGLSHELAELERLRSAHLPKLLQSYIDIPPEHRAQVFRETGRSASYLLDERLDKMLDRLEDISSMLARGNVDAFTQNIHFIDARYGPSPFD